MKDFKYYLHGKQKCEIGSENNNGPWFLTNNAGGGDFEVC